MRQVGSPFRDEKSKPSKHAFSTTTVGSIVGRGKLRCRTSDRNAMTLNCLPVDRSDAELGFVCGESFVLAEESLR